MAAGSRIGVQGANIGAVPYSVDPNTSNSLLAWNCDIAGCASSTPPTAATIYLMKIPVLHTITITNVVVYVSVAGTSYTNTQLGLYDSTGALLAATAVLASAGTNTFGTTGSKVVALTAAQTVTGGPSAFVWGAVHMGTNNATTVSFAAPNTGTSINVGITNVALYRSAKATGHATNDLATIGSFVPAGLTQGSTAPWIGVS